MISSHTAEKIFIIISAAARGTGRIMFTAKNYVLASSLEEAYRLNRRKGCRIVGGMQWMKMERSSFDTLIDLSALHLDTIAEDETGWQIGAMTTLRQLEQHKELEAYTGGAMKEALRHIVGVQFRNLATVGGTAAGRYGFSDLLTLLLVLPTQVTLYKAGNVPIADYLRCGLQEDMITGIHIDRSPLSCHYESMRLTETDLPILTCAVSRTDTLWRIAIGARPPRAIEYIEPAGADTDPDGIARRAADNIPVGSNMRASADYRRHLIRVLVRRSIEALQDTDHLHTQGERHADQG